MTERDWIRSSLLKTFLLAMGPTHSRRWLTPIRRMILQKTIGRDGLGMYLHPDLLNLEQHSGYVFVHLDAYSRYTMPSQLGLHIYPVDVRESSPLLFLRYQEKGQREVFREEFRSPHNHRWHHHLTFKDRRKSETRNSATVARCIVHRLDLSPSLRQKWLDHVTFKVKQSRSQSSRDVTKAFVRLAL